MSYDFKTGDIYFVSGTAWYSAIIKWMTFGKMTHVGLGIDPETVFETDGAIKKAKYRKSSSLDGRIIECFRPKFLDDMNRLAVKAFCDKYNGTRYDYWDVFLNAIFFFLATPIKKWLIEKLGSKTMLKCDEITMLVLFRATGYEGFIDWETWNPSDFYKSVTGLWKEDFELIWKQ